LHHQSQKAIKGTLYVVATPIGNLRDISLRAIDILSSADVIAAEDTRVISHLLKEYSIRAKLISLHEHNEHLTSKKILDLLQQNQSIAIVSDAGTPAISDPGTYVVAAAKQAGFTVVPIPGANAVITALSAAGLNAVPFLFYGFLPNKSKARRELITKLRPATDTLVFYEAPHRVVETVKDLAELLEPQRPITIARELTKIFETIYACPLNEAADWLEADANRQKGEFVLIIKGAENEPTKELSTEALQTLSILLEELPLKQAVDLATRITGGNRKVLYAEALNQKKDAEKN
jgi:16S rRNA (cytidine1402-2'-O)-methyltransferase